MKPCQRRPKITAPLRQSNRGQFIRRQADQRRAQHSQQGHVLQRIVQQREQAEQVDDLLAFVKPAARHHQRHAERFEHFGVTLRLVPRRTQQDHHVPPIHRFQFPLLPNRMLFLAQLAKPQRHEPRLHFRVGKIGQVVGVKGFFVVAVLRLVAGQMQMQFRSRSRIGCRGQRRAFVRSAEAQARAVLISHAADLAPHQPDEQAVHEIQNRLMTAEIVGQWNDLATLFGTRP